MKVTIFNGKENVEVEEKSKFELPGVWQWNVNDEVSFSLEGGRVLKTKVTGLTGSGTEFKVLEIIASNPLDQMKIDAVDVGEVEINLGDEGVILEVPKKSSKKDLVAIIDEYELDIDKKKTKKEIFAILNEMDNIKIV